MFKGHIAPTFVTFMIMTTVNMDQNSTIDDKMSSLAPRVRALEPK